jgi:hypothetical protein
VTIPSPRLRSCVGDWEMKQWCFTYLFLARIK